MAMRPQLKVSSKSLVRQGFEPATAGFQGEWFIHFTTETPIIKVERKVKIRKTCKIQNFGSKKMYIIEHTFLFLPFLVSLKKLPIIL